MEQTYNRFAQYEDTTIVDATQRRAIAHTATGPIYLQSGIVWMYPLMTGLHRMRELHVRAVYPEHPVSLASVRRLNRHGARALHQRAVTAALATFRAASDADRQELCRGVFHYARSVGGSDGIESVLLSAIVSANRLSPRLAAAGLEIWQQVGAPAHLGGGLSLTPVLDTSAGVVSFLSQADLAGFGADLSVQTGMGPARAGGPGALGAGGSEAAADKDSTCVGIVAIGLGILGAVGGVLVTNAAMGSSTSTSTRNSGDVGAGIGGSIAAGGVGLALGQQLCGDAAPGGFGNGPATSTYGPSGSGQDTSGTTTDTSDQAGYNEGFGDGWAAATNSPGGDAPTVGAGYSQGFVDGYAAASAAATVAPGDSAPAGTTVVDGSSGTSGSGSDDTNQGTPTDGTPTDSTPTGDGPTPTSAGTPDPDGDGGGSDDHEGASAVPTRGSATGPGLTGTLTRLTGGDSFALPGLGQSRGTSGGLGAGVPGVVTGHGPDDRDTGDGPDDTDGGGSLALGGHISIDLPAGRDPELNPHAFAPTEAGFAQ
ncbi:MAG TPA: hypothetical protein VGX23_28380 [Actinocrinis sp.]|nr:hypothetical protein [Actinocrinis sp.]